MDSKSDIKNFLNKLSLKKNEAEFDLDLFELALTHSSYSVENKLGNLGNNERLEFYGDSVLRLACCKYLFDKFPQEREGVLTSYKSQLVSDATLALYAEKINLGAYLRVADRPDLKSEKAHSTILACAFEAFLGAYFIQSNFENVYDFLVEFFAEHISYVENNIKKINAKATLQEYTQGLNKDLPKYSIIKEEGQAHNKSFTAEVRYKGEIAGLGTGKTKKEAEQNAAYNALLHYGVLNE